MDPINYTQQVKNPFESAIQGYQAGLAIKQQQAAAAQAQAQAQAQQQMQSDLAGLATNKNATTSDYVSIMTKYPDLAEKLKTPLATLTEEQKQNKLNDATKIYSALQSGNADIAKTLLTEQATALRNSGKESEAKNAEAMAQLVELHPDVARTTAGLGLSAIMGPDKFASTFEALGKERREEVKAPIELGKLKSEAETARIKAQYAEPDAVIELQKKGWDIKKIESDIMTSREANRIAAMNAATNREAKIGENSLKHQEMQLKLQEEKGKIQDKLNARVAEAESAFSGIDNSLNTIDKVLAVPDVVKRAAMGPIDSMLPTVQTDVADFESLLETVKSQAFINNLIDAKNKGATFGALDKNEGAKLEANIANLGTKQSVRQLSENLKETQRLLLKSRKAIAKRTGMPEPVPDTPAASAKAKGKSTDEMLKELGVM